MIDKIIEIVGETVGLTREEMLSDMRHAFIIDGRAMVYAMARKIDPRKYTLSEIARKLNKTHGTVVHGLRVHDKSMEIDRYYFNKYNEALNMFYNWESGYIIEREEREIDTPYGKRIATITIKYNQYK